MKYSKRDLRAADILALILVGVGFLFGGLSLSIYYSLLSVEGVDIAELPRIVLNAGSGMALRLLLLGITFSSLGGALNLKLRRLSTGDEREGDTPEVESTVAATDSSTEDGA